MAEIVLNRTIPPEAQDALKQAIIATVPTYAGLVSRLGAAALVFIDPTSDADMNTALQIALTFDTNIRTAAQIQETAEKADINSLLALADNAIAAIGTELTFITADGAALTAAGSLAAVKPIVQNMLDRQATMVSRQRAIIKALKRMRTLL